MPARTAAAVCALACTLTAQEAEPHPDWLGKRAPGFWGRTAPEWRVEEWFQLPEGKDRLRLPDFAGKVVYLYCFQSWCPGCHETGFPNLRKMVEHYEGRDDVAFVAVQTVFEGSSVNTLENAEKVAARYALEIPFGHDATAKGSTIMKDYHTLGTPWVIVIDQEGKLRFSMFDLPYEQGVDLIDWLVEPGTRNGIAGEEIGSLEGLEWLGEKPDPGKRRYTLLRWWTDGCPFCESSLPDLARLEKEMDKEHGSDFFDVVAVYHQKRAGRVTDDFVAEYAAKVGYGGTLARDPEWSKLRELMRRADLEDYTSVSFLVDGQGKVVWVHEGPRLHRSDEFPAADEAMRELEAFLRRRSPPRGEGGREDADKDGWVHPVERKCRPGPPAGPRRDS